MSRSLSATLALLLGGSCLIPAAYAAEGCFEQLAATRNGSLGQPIHATPTPDGRSVLFLRSGPRDTRLQLFRYDLASQAETELAHPADAPEHLSVEEKARRERARMTLTGITDFALSKDGSVVLATEADHLLRIALPSGQVGPVPGTGWIAPRLSPDGTHVAAVRDNDLHVVDLATGQDRQLTTGGTDTLTHGLPEFAASEELDRADGSWWSPDGSTLLYEEADTSGVETHYIADPAHPSVTPVSFRYPRAGTANARVRLGLVSRDGGATRWVDWDSTAFPYLVRVVWPEHGRLSLVVMNRAETEERVLAVDPATGHADTILTDTDPAWVNATPELARDPQPLPHWLADGSGFLWAAERNGAWQLELHHADGSLDHALTGPQQPFLALEDVDARTDSVLFEADPDRLGTGLYRVSLRGGAATPVAAEPGWHSFRFAERASDAAGPTIFTDTLDGADGTLSTRVRDADGHVLTTLPSHAETPSVVPRVEFTRAGARDMDALVIRPQDYVAGRHYPVLLEVYAGPDFKTVVRAPRQFLEDQCMANYGFVVVSVDGRGTPGRGHDWERAIKNDLIDIPLGDQVEGLQALGRRYHEMDLTHAGVNGWSFGGYFTAMATIRRPDVFKAGVAGAPVVDFADYDTAYTERYLGTPQDDAAGYRTSNVLTYAASLSRPLLIMHGLTDDNVYFENTVKLTQALTTAGKPYQLLLLPGTHQLPDPVIRARVGEARMAFLQSKLQPSKQAQ